MRAVVLATMVASLVFPVKALASRRCPVDLAPLVTSHFRLTLINDATTDEVPSSGELLVSEGGAVTLMRTDIDAAGKSSRFFVSGRLDTFQLVALKNAVADALPAAPAETCLIESFEEPGGGHSLFGISEHALYRDRQTTVRVVVTHNDPSAGPTPQCPSQIRALDNVIRHIADAIRLGVRPLQCRP